MREVEEPEAVAVFDALLDLVEGGEQVTTLRQGVRMARLVPVSVEADPRARAEETRL